MLSRARGNEALVHVGVVERGGGQLMQFAEADGGLGQALAGLMSGNFTLTDMYEQFAAVKGMGPFKKVLQMLPGMSSNVPDEMLNSAEGRLEKWQVIIQSMTPKEKENPKILNSSRARRIARGSGTTEKDVKELVKQYFMMRKMLKTFKRKKKLPFGLGGKGECPRIFQ